MSAPQKSSRWGSFLSQAVAGVEARLDNILSEEESLKQAATQRPARTPTRTPSTSSTTASTVGASVRSTTPSRSNNDRLQERLARAVAAKNAAQRSESSPARSSVEIGPRLSSDVSTTSSATEPQSSAEGVYISKKGVAGRASAPSASSDGALVRPSTPTADEEAPVKDVEVMNDDTNILLRGSQEARAEENPKATDVSFSTDILGIEIASSSLLYEQRITELEKSLETSHAQHQEELHSHVERVDALQAKLLYLAREASEAARNAANAAPAGSQERKLAEKDQQVAQLMEEGQKLASTEQKHRSIIKKLRGELAVNEKEINNQKLARQKLENELIILRKRLDEQGDVEKVNAESQKLISQLRRDLEKVRAEITSKDNTIFDLKNRLREESDRAKSTAAKLNDQLREAGQERVKELEDAVAALQVEKGLLADRAKLQIAELQEKADRAAERFHSMELEMKGEIQILESKLETLRVRAEEASSGAVGDTQAKLLRQIETLQTQYAIASENWQGIEASLIAKSAALEKERDEALRRESEMRRKARETVSNQSCRREIREIYIPIVPIYVYILT
ncbi:uncharacterized protein GGS25DRAFT_346550 [Hypoxylon fragiforme]|uniref:uncharacterized protein n=1 Tax=Hypoxylon fragiforme TaxID=63214 RepID=UPI0020C5EDE0|nr:uncharacterized protein GGS25DRAFT_346550 [Hypoxylon fragiforme]KAI2607683.1 hypothetical protein GGS25DRAFT_346550 [Hypoxylon fragiforme]